MQPTRYLIEHPGGELQLLAEDEMKAIVESDESFDGFVGNGWTLEGIIEPLSIIHLEKARMKWAAETFPEATALSSIYKLREEADAIEQNLLDGKPDPMEYADALMCLLDSAGRAGITPLQILEAFQEKILINKSRKWVKNPDNTYSHVKQDLI
ncbi:dATP/dGTP pyrophosphohydrolase domain-containing protein [Salmonirosea aquatica]|uniref:DUF550 domain-containing protein n=1 Tax=Salmonirosea aquatica TaxID=2654236 RepID=A0A7C9BV39_9BACT|nr:DUF550 domain-containing protein [Cytophagaceae bacterium SJW1-29]